MIVLNFGYQRIWAEVSKRFWGLAHSDGRFVSFLQLHVKIVF